ncbi:hypothetical protein ACFQ3Z_02885 [Streptomyces nogalater]
MSLPRTGPPSPAAPALPGNRRRRPEPSSSSSPWPSSWSCSTTSP